MSGAAGRVTFEVALTAAHLVLRLACANIRDFLAEVDFNRVVGYTQRR